MSRFVRSGVAALSIFTGLFYFLTGCTKHPNDQAEKVVNLAIWANYLSPEMQEKFTRETGIKIQVSNYSSNEELLAKIQAGAAGIDVAVPSDYMVGIMTKLEVLRPLEHSKLPNTSGLDPALMKQEYDPENAFSMPYAWTTAGIAVNRDLYKGEVKSWKDLFENQDLAGKMALLDDVREVTAAALKMHGYSVNTTDPDELKKAEETLKKIRSNVKMFRSDMIDPLINKEVAAAQVYSSDALLAAAKGHAKIEYILPEEGGTRAIENLVILKSAKNVEAAHKLINFLLSAEANASFVKEIMGGPVVLKAKEMLPPNLKSNTSLFPPAATLSKFEGLKDVGETTRVYDRIWTGIKAD